MYVREKVPFSLSVLFLHKPLSLKSGYTTCLLYGISDFDAYPWVKFNQEIDFFSEILSFIEINMYFCGVNSKTMFIMNAKKIKVELTFEEVDLICQCVRYFKSDILKVMIQNNEYDSDYIEKLHSLLCKFDLLVEHHV